MIKVPIVFAFDDNYALPASIAVKSLLDYRAEGTKYDIYVLYSNLSSQTIKKMNSIYPIKWIKVDASRFKNVPKGWSGLETYYRLLIHELLPQYDKILWSDVDVLFQGDLSSVYEQDIGDNYWSGVKAEYNNEGMIIHNYLPENKNEFMYMPGFMVINARKMRENNMTEKFFDIIRKFGPRLNMFDLDVLNLACNKIGDIPFTYCVLENIYDESDISKAKEYPFLSKIFSDEDLEYAKKYPVIIHYAGKYPKIWNRSHADIPEYYWSYIETSPFYDKDRYFFSFKNLVKYYTYDLLRRVVFIKKYRRMLKAKRDAVSHI